MQISLTVACLYIKLLVGPVYTVGDIWFTLVLLVSINNVAICQAQLLLQPFPSWSVISRSGQPSLLPLWGGKNQIPLRYLVRSRFEAGRRQVRSWFAPVCDQDSVMEFCFEPVCDLLRAGSSCCCRPVQSQIPLHYLV